MYRRVITLPAKRSLKKLPLQLRKNILEISEILEKNPFAGEKLSGALYFLYSFHFKSNNVEYRLAYTIDHERKFIVIHFVNARENFYQKLRRLFR